VGRLHSEKASPEVRYEKWDRLEGGRIGVRVRRSGANHDGKGCQRNYALVSAESDPEGHVYRYDELAEGAREI